MTISFQSHPSQCTIVMTLNGHECDRMAPTQSKLNSKGTVARRDVTGEPSQVYDMPDAAAWIIKQVDQKNAISIFRINYDCQWLHIYAPQIVNDLHGNPEFIVGNASDVLGE